MARSQGSPEDEMDSFLDRFHRGLNHKETPSKSQENLANLFEYNEPTLLFKRLPPPLEEAPQLRNERPKPRRNVRRLPGLELP